MSDFYPILLNLKDKKVCVIGGGRVAERKVKNLISTGGQIHIISPVITRELLDLSDSNSIIWHKKNYETNDINGAWLVFAATNNPEINKKILKDAQTERLFCNVADSPEDCAFIVPSIIKRGELIVSISTGGNIPALTKKIRERLEIEFPDNYGIYIKFLGQIRKFLKDNFPPEKRIEMSRALTDAGLLESFLSKDWENLEKFIKNNICEEAVSILSFYKD
jgi:precorrin-2 dehydrogenase/sirohydrochlorin ferrochelatase